MILVPVSPETLPAAWEHVEPYAVQMADRFPDDWPVDETVRQVMDGQAMLWLVWDEGEERAFGAVLTECRVKASGKKVMVLTFASGRDHRRWVPMVERTLTDHAIRNGCASLDIEGRTGWASFMGELPGWQVRRWMVASKELTT